MVTGVTLVLCVLSVASSQTPVKSPFWGGNTCATYEVIHWLESYCVSESLWWCTVRRQRIKLELFLVIRCCPGWKHNGNQRCNIPICSPECQNGGTCVAPDECKCREGQTGSYTACTTEVCSYLFPCYPGMCIYPDSCNCNIGFNGTGQDACLTMTPEKGMPDIGLSTCTLSSVNPTDGTTKFAYIADGSTREKNTLWSNQKDFNYLKFEFQSVYIPPPLPRKPFYVRDSGFGIVDGTISINISRSPRSDGPIRDVAFTKQYNCQGLSDTNPKTDIANCTIIDDRFSTNIEHGDWLNVVFTAKSGGYRNLVKTYLMQNFWTNQTYYGQTARTEVEFKFDFEAPLHCSESGNSTGCRPIDTPLKIENEFTKMPINISWAGWTDGLSTMERYHLEVFKLSPDSYGNLEEMTPLNPVYYTVLNHTHDNIYRHSYTPIEDGMYSVLLEAADKANNSKIARRLVLYSPTSNISLNEKDDDKIFVSTAVQETGYMWQAAKVGTKMEITVEWANHFANKFIEDGNLLNKVKPYPTQFQEIQRDNILHSLKFVNQNFDDDEGARTKSEKPNKHGIVRFEAVMSFSDDTTLPIHGWFDIDNLAEKFSFNVNGSEASTARIWVRAHDILGNTLVDGTEVNFDITGPSVRYESVSLLRNQVNGTYNYTSRVKFQAVDWESGLHKIGFTLTRDDTREVIYAGFVAGSSKNTTGSCRRNLECICVREVCFLPDQTMDLDNCWFTTAREELNNVSVTLDIIVYNQALLSKHFSLKIDKLDTLEGLEKYSGSTNIHVAHNLSNGVRLAWDLPESESCYGHDRRTDIVIILYMHDSTTKRYIVNRTINVLDIRGLNPDDNYKVVFSLHYDNQPVGNMLFRFKTGYFEEPRIKIISIQQFDSLGNKIVLFCQLSKDADSSALWWKNASRVVTDQKYITVNNTLTVVNIEETDRYDNFSCADDLDSIRSKPYRIRIDGPDSIAFIPDEKFIDEFGALNITCLADCYISCSFQWIKHGHYDLPEMLVSDLATMQIPSASRKDTGNYSCTAKNTVTNKTVVASITLEVIYHNDSRNNSPGDTKVPDKESSLSDTTSMSLILLGVAVILTCLMCGFFVYKSRKRLSSNISTASEVGLPDVDPGISNEFDLVNISINPITNYWTIRADSTGGLRSVIDETDASGSPVLGSRPCPIMQNEPSETLEETRLQTDEDAYFHPI